MPEALADWPLELEDGGRRLAYSFNADAEGAGIPALLRRLGELGVDYKDLDTPRARWRISSSTSSERAAMNASTVNLNGIWAIYRGEMARTARTIWQSVATPVITTALYFVVFGGAIGSRMQQVGGVSYGAFIVPGLIMLSLLTQSISNASIGIYFPEIHRHRYSRSSPRRCPRSRSSSPMSARRRPNRSRSASIILATATLFVPVHILHPFWMVAFLMLTSVAFSLFGFIIGIWAKNFEQLAIIPSLVVTPLTFLGGAFYSIDMLPPFWRRSACSIPWSISSAASAGASTASATSASPSASASRRCSSPFASRSVVDFPHRLAPEALSASHRGELTGVRRAFSIVDHPPARWSFAMPSGLVIVTGGSRGIGAAICQRLAADGHAVAVNYTADAKAAKTTVAEIKKSGGRAQAFQADVADPAQLPRLFDQAAKALGPLAGLVNNAGVTGAAVTTDQREGAELTQLFAINVIGTILACKEAVLRLSMKHGGSGGSIVNISSIAARLGGLAWARELRGDKGGGRELHQGSRDRGWALKASE